MRLSVKVVGGCECECDASPDSSVEELKRDVEAKLKLGKETEQKLLFRGKALQDGTSLSDYKLTDGAKLNLVLKRRENSALTSGDTNSQGATNYSNTPPKEPLIAPASSESKSSIHTSSIAGITASGVKPRTGLNQQSQSYVNSKSNIRPSEEELYRALRPHFRTNDDTKKVVVTFMQIFQHRLAALSLDDIERLTRTYNKTNTLRF